MRLYPTLYLTWSIFKTQIREPLSLIWAFILPLVVIIPFGFINIGGVGSLDVGIVDNTGTATSTALIAALEQNDAINLTIGSKEEEEAAMQAGDRDLVVILPAELAVDATNAEVQVLYHIDRVREAQIGGALLHSYLDRLTYGEEGPPGRITIVGEYIDARDKEYRDFLVPGVIAAAIMQIGMFSVSFAFLGMKRTGVLRRLRATPLNPASLLIAHSASRLLVMALQVLILTGVAVLGFGIEFEGNFFALLLAAIIGGSVFLALGFAVSGGSSSERIAVPIANMIVLAMMFLSGVFFSQDIPGFLGVISDGLPLTFMVDAMRGIALDGESLADRWTDLAGMGVWLAAGLLVARFVFRWE